MKSEQWKEVLGYEGRYWVSDLGAVKSRRGIMATPSNSAGYPSFRPYKNGASQTLTVHREMMKAFTPSQEWRPDINHKNGDKKDNRRANLEWCTRSHNLRHSYRVLGRIVLRGSAHWSHVKPERRVIGENNGRAKLTAASVVEIRNIFAAGGVTKTALAKSYKVGITQIGRVLSGVHWNRTEGRVHVNTRPDRDGP